MARTPTSRTKRLLKGAVTLMRNTTWKCGRVERRIIQYLQKTGRYIEIADMIRHFRLEGKPRAEFLDALGRLEKRFIIKIQC